ncbi:MAG: bifunctional pyr operon transcriptional regulator/uracil phosphoribosyltransferase [Phycisphaeraceae bacterium]|nr:bifunctional pyr operon transcriptional regulator/uracil phosphoribosyltransferase [Phycisphaeraceae bacterium]
MQVIADAARVSRLISDLAQRIQSDMDQLGEDQDWAMVGVRSRGDELARRLAEQLGIERVGTVDITLYRDDLSEVGHQPVVRTTEIDFPIDGLHVVLVDDVLMTGRSIRAALQLLMDLGRPRRVWLTVLADRGGRELPIQPDHVGLDLSERSDEAGLRPEQRVDVLLEPTDDGDRIEVRSGAAADPAQVESIQ